ncbi:DUF1349 domain-containing protein [Microbacterium halotolerans]|uniref:beta-xylosidase family glycoside hydrolase n=1 Tax=Microbacterium halotolerans TaxID=246613 RepID=UPI000E6AD6E4|nr:DUF1349 domain-containing protein [Microbacterium halotolerans]
MRSTIRRLRRAALTVTAVAAAATVASTGVLPASATTAAPASGAVTASEVAPPPDDWPEFGYQGIVTDKPEMDFGANEYIFPSVFHAGAHLEDPLGEWYLYTAPHDDPGGIILMYADSPEGPWTEHQGNPLISRVWEPHYNLEDGRPGARHVSSPDAFWNAEEGKLFLYFHGDNSVTRYATSDDGVTFEYGGEAVTNAMGDAPGTPKVTESSYARVFDHPDPDSEYEYAMFYMANDDAPVDGGLRGIRRIRLAESVDARTWVVDPAPVVEPGVEEGANVSAANIWEHDGQLYVIYHASSGKSYARTIDPTLRDVGDLPIVLHEASGLGTDVGRVAAPEIVEDGDETYLFYESGDRLGGTIAWAKDGADTVVEPPFGGFPADEDNPVFATCAAPGSDEFESALGDDWQRTIREELARHETTDGALTIPTYEGGVAAAPLLQQPLPTGAWQVTTTVSLDPSQKYQQAGLLLYASDTDYVKLDMGRAGPGRVTELVSAGSPSFTTQQRYDGSELWLRLTSDGKQIEGSVSSDGTTFDRLGSPFGAETSPGVPRFTHIGPFAFRGSATTAEITASFDWLRFSPDAEAYEECMTDPGDPDDPGTDPSDPDGPGTDTDDTAPTAALTHAQRMPGQQQSVTGNGFAPGETVTGVMNSDPLELGEETADADGTVSFAWTIPSDTAAGMHTVTLAGTDSGTVSADFRVVATGAVEEGRSEPTGPGDLAATGTDPAPVLTTALLLLTLGAAAMAAGLVRRRRNG